MRRIVLVLVLAVLFVSLATPVLADGPDNVVVWGDDYTLESGDRIEGDLLVYGGSAVLEEESKVGGDATVFGGNLTIYGEVAGDVTVWGGNVVIKSEATIRGSVVSIGGSVHREEGADVRGDEVEGWPRPFIQPIPRLPVPPRLPRVRTSSTWARDWTRDIADAFRSAFSVLVMIVLGILVVVFLPRHTEAVAETMIKSPVESFVSGLATIVAGSIALVVVAIVAVLLVITICLAPLGLLLLLPFLVVGIAALFGWIAAGLLLGVKVLRALTHKDPNHVAAVAIGVPILSLLSYIPCVGWTIGLIAMMWSLGAVVYSLFGTRTRKGSSIMDLSRSAGKATEDYDPRMDKE